MSMPQILVLRQQQNEVTSTKKVIFLNAYKHSGGEPKGR